MRRAVAVAVLSMTLALVTALLVPAAVGPGGSRADAAAAPLPPAKRVDRAYGEGPVRLAPRQFGAVTFPARRGDELTLRVKPADGGGCDGSLVLEDRRGTRTKGLDRVFRVRATGKATIWFKGRCRAWGKPSAAVAQLVKVRSREVEMDGRPVRVGPSNKRFVNVAWVRVPRTGRVKLTGRNAQGGRVSSHTVLEGDWLHRVYKAEGASAEHGQPPMYELEPDEGDRVLRRGQRIGLTFARGARVEARSALQHTVELGGPPLTLASTGGREHVISVQVPAGTRTYLDWGTGTEHGWARQYWLEPKGDLTTKDGVYRLVVASDDNSRVPRERTLRIRSILQSPDLVVGGAPVRFESAEAGQWLLADVPAARTGTVQFEASDVAVTGGGWAADLFVPCYRDCFGGASIRSGETVRPGSLPYAEPNRVLFKFDPGASGGVTLRLVR